jgi:hypothetical protein
MPSLILLALSLAFMLARVVAPAGPKPEGRVLREVTLNLRERLAMQQLNLIAFGVILVLLTIGHWIRLPFEILAILAAYGILMVPARYTLTTTGIGLNRVVFRRWSEFAAVETTPQKVHLIGRPGNGRFPIWLRGQHQNEVLGLVRRNIYGSRSPGEAAEPLKGGDRQKTVLFRRIFARHS